MSLAGNNAAFGKLPGLKLPSMVSGSFAYSQPQPLSAYATPTFKLQSSIPGATAGGSQIDSPGGAGGYASGPGQAATQQAISTQLGSDNTAAQIKNYQDQYAGLLSSDPTYNAQVKALNDSLHDQYGSSVLAPGQSAEVAYGGALPTKDASGNTIDYSSYAAPRDLSGNSFSRSLVDALNDPNTVANATANPYSDLASIQRQLDLANQGADANAVARGMGFSGEIGQHHNENLDAANQARYTAQGNFLGSLSGAYNNWLGQLSAGAGTLGGYQNSLSSRVLALINAGILAGKPQATGGTTTPPTIYGPGNGGEGSSDALNNEATSGVSAYSPDYIGSNVISPQPISSTNFYTDASLGAQSQTAAAQKALTQQLAANPPAAPYVGTTGVSGYSQKSKANIH